MAIALHDVVEMQVQAHAGSQSVLNTFHYQCAGVPASLSGLIAAFTTLWRAVTNLLNQAYILDQYFVTQFGAAVIDHPGPSPAPHVHYNPVAFSFNSGNGTTDNGQVVDDAVPLFAGLNCRKTLLAYFDRTAAAATQSHRGKGSAKIGPLNETDILPDGVTVDAAPLAAYTAAVNALKSFADGGGGSWQMIVLNKYYKGLAVPAAGTGADSLFYWICSSIVPKATLGSQTSRKGNPRYY